MNDQNTVQYDANLNKPLDIQVEVYESSATNIEAGGLLRRMFLDDNGEIVIKGGRIVLLDADGSEGIVLENGAIKLYDEIVLEQGSIKLSDGTHFRTVISDGAIVVNDGSNDRVLIGYQSGGF